jgi:hypothetical protein
MTDLFFRGGPKDGLKPSELSVDDDQEYLWIQNTSTGETERYRRTGESVDVEGVSRIVFEYAPE